MKKLFWTVSALALAGLCFTGCDEELNDILNPEYKPVDNEKYCDGTCGKGDKANAPNCFTMDINSTDEDDTYCAACSENCALTHASDAPNCVQEDPTWGSYWGCAAKAECPAGQGFEKQTDGTLRCTNLDTAQCKANTDCREDERCDMDTHLCVRIEDDPSVEEQFTYVRIDDMMGACEGTDGKSHMSNGVCTLDDPGADIDAIVLVKADGTPKYASDIVGYKRSDITGTFKTLAEVKAATKDKEGISYTAADPTAILGKPDSFETYGNNFDGKCKYFKTVGADGKGDSASGHPYVSLGGQGGYIEVEMEDKIEAGDTLDVLEVGECELYGRSDGKTGTKAQADKVKVSVSVSSEDGSWKLIGEDQPTSTNKGILSFKISDNMLK